MNINLMTQHIRRYMSYFNKYHKNVYNNSKLKSTFKIKMYQKHESFKSYTNIHTF